MKRDADCERRCLYMFTLNFGKTRPEVWIRSMSFERDAGDPKNISKLHKNALDTLKPELLDEFSAVYIAFQLQTE